uniref:Uncharacterized protein n=1 Tax=Arundo donax TaxID=35708 RepID=A0A0A8YRV4_ARUDO
MGRPSPPIRRDPPSAARRRRLILSPSPSPSPPGSPQPVTVCRSPPPPRGRPSPPPPPDPVSRTGDDEPPAALRRRRRLILSTPSPSPPDSPPSPAGRGLQPSATGSASTLPTTCLPRAAGTTACPTRSLRPSPARTSASSEETEEHAWNGPGLHGFVDLPHLLHSVRDLDRFLTRKEELCILQNAALFAEEGDILDASDDRNRPDFHFLVVNRPTLLQMGVASGMGAGNYWPGYKRNLNVLSKERRISTLKVTENTFLWRHEICGKRLLRRRVSLNKDEGPFEDEAQVYYILQYQKLPRTKKSNKAAILARRAERGHY